MFGFIILVLLFNSQISISRGSQVPTPGYKHELYPAVRNEAIDLRIVQGHPISITEAPYQLQLDLIEPNRTSICGASIISPLWAITAARCVKSENPEKNIQLLCGSAYLNEGKVHSIHQVVIHDKFHGTTNSTIRYDIALLQVSDPFEYSPSVQPIKLADRTPSAGTPARATGWGSALSGLPSSKELLQIDINIIDHSLCILLYERGAKITTDMLCAGSLDEVKGACKGDTGGPLVANGELVGIASWRNEDICGALIDVFTDIAILRQWIHSITGV